MARHAKARIARLGGPEKALLPIGRSIAQGREDGRMDKGERSPWLQAPRDVQAGWLLCRCGLLSGFGL